ncbi:sodium:solute symporter family protein [bacterium]|nr:sodium:solute symporter family protein [bacterium]
MNDSILPFGPGGLSVIGLYLFGLLLIGWMGHRARKEDTLKDFYLGGSGIGFVALLLTLYATQYSGNTMLGFSGRAYRSGFTFLVSVHFMISIIIGYLLFAPQLHRLSKKFGFITPTDFLDHRFKSTTINILGPIIMIAALGNYLLAQLIAMGRALQGLTTLPPQTAFIAGVVILASIILVYETLGGFRAIAWTDVLQGVILMLGFAALVYLILDRFGSLSETTAILLNGSEADRAKTLPPSPVESRRWISYVILFGLGASLYPQAIQRIFAARSERALQKGLAVMAFLPFTTALIVVFVGVVGAAHIPDLNDSQTDRILTIICREVQSSSVFGYWLVVILFAGILGALMSTADSCLLTLSSMITKDLYRRFIHPTASESLLTKMGKTLSWGIVVLMVGLAIYLNQLEQKPTLVKLLDMKFDMLVQLVPAFMIGIHSTRLQSLPVAMGMIAGLIVTFGLYWSDSIRQIGFHMGLYGLIVNLTIALLGSAFISNRSANRQVIR